MGEILSAYPREEYALATKVFYPMGPRDQGLGRKQILKQLDASLARLQTDYVTSTSATATTTASRCRRRWAR